MMVDDRRLSVFVSNCNLLCNIFSFSNFRRKNEKKEMRINEWERMNEKYQIE